MRHFVHGLNWFALLHLFTHSPAPRRRELDYLSGSRTPLLRFELALNLNLLFRFDLNSNIACQVWLKYKFKFCLVCVNIQTNLELRLNSKYYVFLMTRSHILPSEKVICSSDICMVQKAQIHQNFTLAAIFAYACFSHHSNLYFAQKWFKTFLWQQSSSAAFWFLLVFNRGPESGHLSRWTILG